MAFPSYAMFMVLRRLLNLVLSSCYLIFVLRCIQILKTLKVVILLILNNCSNRTQILKTWFFCQLSVERLSSMKKYVFGLGSAQGYETKVLQWSKGKEGNIRSLLSTLQYVEIVMHWRRKVGVVVLSKSVIYYLGSHLGS
ncbi:uncharacterized protein LOC141647855 [Silene latifolia]|uniref:uncharacterized protein LOC141647855 n=1 Tax=Silene latifolia TaxID=37657 RepID=UPI003D781DB5